MPVLCGNALVSWRLSAEGLAIAALGIFWRRRVLYQAPMMLTHEGNLKATKL